jgi:hypothetical protein
MYPQISIHARHSNGIAAGISISEVNASGQSSDWAAVNDPNQGRFAEAATNRSVAERAISLAIV